MQKMRLDFIAGIVVFMLSIAVFTMTKKFPLGRPGIPGPNFFPNLVAGVMAVLSVALFIRTYFFSANPDAAGKRTGINKESLLMVIVTVGTSLIYAWLIEPLGFLVSTTLFLMALAGLYRMGKWWEITVFAASVTLVIYLIFARFLMVQLPAGIFFR